MQESYSFCFINPVYRSANILPELCDRVFRCFPTDPIEVFLIEDRGGDHSWDVILSFGYVKSGLQSADHAGWVKLNGRAVSTLTYTQQAAAATLGITGSLPNAVNAYLTQNDSTIGAVTTSNNYTVTLSSFSGSATSNGSH